MYHKKIRTNDDMYIGILSKCNAPNKPKPDDAIFFLNFPNYIYCCWINRHAREEKEEETK
jgi:hypothetical protein